jgi:hypothetical protein
MKRLLMVLAMVLLPIMAFASPFVVCDPYLTTEVQPTSFTVTLDAGNPVSSSPVAVTGGLILKYDVGTVALGAHTIKVKACITDTAGWECC